MVNIDKWLVVPIENDCLLLQQMVNRKDDNRGSPYSEKPPNGSSMLTLYQPGLTST